MKYQKILLQIIEEEINRYVMEQAAPEAPADPAAAGAEAPPPDADSGEEDVSKTIETLAKKTATDIKKTIISDVQSGDRDKAEKIVATVEAEKEDAPKAMRDAVKNLKRVFKFTVPADTKAEAEKKVEKEKAKKQEGGVGSEVPPPPAGTPAPPVTESRLQNSLREYLFYKKLYEKEKRGSK